MHARAIDLRKRVPITDDAALIFTVKKYFASVVTLIEDELALED